MYEHAFRLKESCITTSPIAPYHSSDTKTLAEGWVETRIPLRAAWSTILEREQALVSFKTSVKAVYPTCGIDYFLLTRIKRMAFWANFKVNIFAYGRSSLYHVTTTTSRGYFFILWMDSRFHAVVIRSRRTRMIPDEPRIASNGIITISASFRTHEGV